MNRFLYKIILCCSIFSACGSVTFAQDIKFITLSSKDGLSSNTVNAVLKDRYGLMWFATDEGLNKYDGVNFTVYRNEPGDTSSLQNNEVSTLYEDHKGGLWVGTIGGGLHLYNRKQDNFHRVAADKSSSGVIGNNIKTIAGGADGKLWVGTLTGLYIIDPVSWKIVDAAKMEPLGKLLQHEMVLCLFLDRSHTMWIGTRKGLFALKSDGKTILQYKSDPRDEYSLSGNIVKTIYEDSDGRIWIGTTTGLSMWRPGSTSFKNFYHDLKDPKSISSDLIYDLAGSQKGELWIATETGLDIMEIRTGAFKHMKTDGRTSFGLKGRSVRSLFIDPAGLYWAGTYEGGVSKYDSNLNLFTLKLSNPFDSQGLSSPFVTSFAEGGAGELYIGTDGGGLNLLNTKTMLLKHLNIIPADRIHATGLVVLSLAHAKNGQLWIGTFQDGLIRYDPRSGKIKQYKQGAGDKALNNNDIFALKEDSNGSLWIGTNGGGLNYYDPLKGTFIKYLHQPGTSGPGEIPLNGFIRSIEIDKNGHIWVGSFGTGLAEYDPVKKRFRLFNQKNSGLPSNKILSIHCDRLGTIWVGTAGNGLVRLDKQTGKFEILGEKRGLANGMIQKILEDETGRLWVSTNRGVSYYDTKLAKFVNYTSYNGLQNNSFIINSGITTSDGYLYFGGREGYNIIHPSELTLNRNHTPVIFTGLTVANKDVVAEKNGIIESHISLARRVDLDYGQNFSIAFAGLNFTSPKQNHYRYRLHGLETDWVNAGTKTVAGYTNLSPGHYVFQVLASNNDGVWNRESKDIAIYIHPPFYMTFYAYLFYALVIIAGLLYIRRRGIKKIHFKYQAEQDRLETERQRELDRLKIKFLTNLSHEFRTPISLILAPVEKLLGNSYATDVSEQANVIKRNAKRLLHLVNQLLDFRKIEERELRLNTSPGEIVSFIRDVFYSFHDLSDRKKIRYRFLTNCDFLHTHFDHDKVERILFNLLSNAFKFTPDNGEIIVTIKEERVKDTINETILLIEVQDTGIGIAEEKINQVFMRFFQCNTIPAGLDQGSGIGLSIAKEFVLLHHGEISVRSELNVGSTFTVKLPLTISKTDEPVSLEKLDLVAQKAYDDEMLGKDLSKDGESKELPLILIVEDNEDFRFYLKDNLRQFYRVIEAANGKEAWQKALSQHPELIVSDISMPEADGVQLCRKLKADKRTSRIPLILLTASTGEEEEIRGLASGANDFLTKPFNFEILRAKVNNFLSYNRTLKDTYGKQVTVTATDVHIESENEKFMKKVLAYIEENLTNTQFSVEDLSKHMGMSRSSLYHRVLEITGQKPIELIRAIKLDKAAMLLEKSNQSIAQIGYMAGFATPNYFAKSFKARFKMLPSEYVQAKRKEADFKLKSE